MMAMPQMMAPCTEGSSIRLCQYLQNPDLPNRLGRECSTVYVIHQIPGFRTSGVSVPMIVRLLLPGCWGRGFTQNRDDFLRGCMGSTFTLKLRDMRIVMMARQPRPIQRGPELSFHVGHS